jgi:membrane-bound inhibitor of C-type lysozyme
VVECQLPKLNVAGSSPVTRFFSVPEDIELSSSRRGLIPRRFKLLATVQVSRSAVTRWVVLLAALGVGVISGHAVAQSPGPLPVVVARQQLTYHCAEGHHVVAAYYGLADGSLDFVKLELPGNVRITLPRLVSGSGVRYSDEARFQWWSKEQAGFLEDRSSDGRWRMKIHDCRSHRGDT